MLLLPGVLVAQGGAPRNPLWHEEKTKNYLPHMTWPEVQDLRTRTDVVIIPVAALEQHSLHMPIGTDFLNGLERAKLVAQKTDALVAPILLPGNSPYHMEFAGTITLSSQTIQQVYFEAAQSLMKHGFRRFALLNSHGGNQIITRYIADRINQETEGTAVELGEAAAPFEPRAPRSSEATARLFDRHGGVGETSTSLYMFPNLVNMSAARTAKLDDARPPGADAARGGRRRSDGDPHLSGRGPEGQGYREEDVDTRDVGHRHVGRAEPERSDG